MTFEKKLDYFSFVKKLSLPGLWILCSLLFCIDFASAQSLTKKDTSEVRFVNSRKFFIYKVGKGETLFSISQKFRIPQEDIHQFNPDLAREGLKGKMKLWIPAYSWLKKEDIKKALSENRLVIVPTDGQKLKNPNFTQPGPPRHMLVIVGYDDTTREFITNDPGTRKGEGYRYSQDVLYEAILDYPTGKHLPVTSSDKVMLTVGEDAALP